MTKLPWRDPFQKFAYFIIALASLLLLLNTALRLLVEEFSWLLGGG